MRTLRIRRLLVTAFTISLLLVPGSAGAAPGAQGSSYDTFVRLETRLPFGPYCVGQDYAATIRPVVLYHERQGQGEGRTRVGESLAGPSVGVIAVPIEASSTNASVATVAPKRVFSGYDLDEVLPGSAYFTIHAAKPGSTNLIFEAVIRGQYVGPVIPIKVVNCKYKVTLSHSGRYSSEGVSGTTTGFMSTTISGEGGELSGSGTFTFSATKAVTGCRATSALSPVGVKITGHVTEAGHLELTLDYAPSFTHSGSLSCPVLGTRSAAQTYNSSEILAVTKITLPGEGPATRSFPYACYPGGSCTLRVTAVPLAQ